MVDKCQVFSPEPTDAPNYSKSAIKGLQLFEQSDKFAVWVTIFLERVGLEYLRLSAPKASISYPRTYLEIYSK